jgi:hypothetical protein
VWVGVGGGGLPGWLGLLRLLLLLLTQLHMGWRQAAASDSAHSAARTGAPALMLLVA